MNRLNFMFCLFFQADILLFLKWMDGWLDGWMDE